MKIILSRKGFDSGYGGVASPIMPDGRMISLPIPERPGAIVPSSRRYGHIHAGHIPVGRLVRDLTGGKLTANDAAHLDPDLDTHSVASRPPGWLPAFGQTGAAATHLRNQGVGPGDVFLFFGWFRNAQNAGGKFHFKQGAPNLHACFGWLQVDRILPVVPLSGLPPQLADHSHCKSPPYGTPDEIYTSTGWLNLPGLTHALPGAGLLGPFQPKYQLTAPGKTRSIWQLPSWFHPLPAKPLTGHTDERRWTPAGGNVLLRSICQGQEFVLDCDQYPSALQWLINILV